MDNNKKPHIFHVSKYIWALALLIAGVAGDVLLANFQQPTAGLVFGFILVVIASLLVLDSKKLSFFKRAYWTRNNQIRVVLIFVVVAGLVISFAVLNNEMEKPVPKFTLTDTMVDQSYDNSTHLISVRVNTYRTNTGDAPAYNPYIKGVVAPLEDLQNARVISGDSNESTVKIGEKIVIPLAFSVIITEPSSEYAPNTGVAFYCDLQYYDSQEENAKKYHHEQWSVASYYSTLVLMPDYARDIFEKSVKRALDK